MRWHLSVLLLVGSLVLITPRGASAGCDVIEVGSRMFGERIRDVEVDGDHAFVAAGYHGLVIVNVLDPTTPWIEGVVEFAGYAQDVEVEGTYAYVAASGFGVTGGLYVIDILDRALPVEVAHYGTSFDRLAVSGTTIYALDAASGLNLVDITSPINPTSLSLIDLPGTETDVAVEGTTAYVGVHNNDDNPFLVIGVDVSNPLFPTQATSLDTGDRIPIGLQAVGPTVYVTAIGDDKRGLIIQDFSVPTAPVEISFLSQPNARSVRVEGTRAYYGFGSDHSFGGGTGGLRVLDTSNLMNPVPIGVADTTLTETAALAIKTTPGLDHVYAAVSGEDAGLRIYEVSNCPNVTTADVFPGTPDNWLPLTLDIEIGVEIPGSATFDASTIDVNSLVFGPGQAPALTAAGFAPVLADQNSDGWDDLRVLFQQSTSALTEQSPQGCVEGTSSAGDFAACDWIYPNYPPTALPDVSFTGIFAPVTVNFSGTPSSDPEGDMLTFIWSYSDGAPSDPNENTVRVYASFGEHEATLTVTDTLGQTGEQVLEFRIDEDSDGDGISDDDEFGDDVQNPADSDGDGTPDYLDLDSDNDGLLDHEEDLNLNGNMDSVKSYLHETNRIHPDSDLDGFSDYVEVTSGTDPRDAESFPFVPAVPSFTGWGMAALASALAATGRRRLSRHAHAMGAGPE